MRLDWNIEFIGFEFNFVGIIDESVFFGICRVCFVFLVVVFILFSLLYFDVFFDISDIR